jgi:TonB family protein
MLKNRYLIFCSIVLIFMALILVACSNNHNIRKTTTKGVIRLEDAPIIDRYLIESAYQINKKWIASADVKSIDPKSVASIKFKIIPDGVIRDILLVDKSGNTSLDDAAIDTIKRASPLEPHPKGLSKTYVEMGLRFGPEGVK